MSSFNFIDLPGHGRVYRDREPNTCPHCAHKVSPEELNWSVSARSEKEEMQLECVFRCVNASCLHLFIATYRLVNSIPTLEAEKLAQSFGFVKATFKLASSYPVVVPKLKFAPELQILSPSFVETYHQAEQAEAYGLRQICGLGYRKAVEYLIKDYCISEAPLNAEQIKAMPVAQCIAKYIQDPRIEAATKRAVWLGNDEAHYVRKWIDKDVADLKVLIRLACNWIESSLLTARYRDEMS